jgi:NADH-quinone oxidoreductase subunit L
VLYDKYYVDEIYDFLFVKSINGYQDSLETSETTLASVVLD